MMKKLLICALMTSFLSNIGYAVDADTDCIGTAESTTRANTKLDISKPKPAAKPSSGVTIQ